MRLGPRCNCSAATAATWSSRAPLNCQIRDHLEAALPGYAACFDKLWESPIPWHLLRHYPTAGQLRDAGLASLCQSLRQAGIRFQQRTVQAVVDWAEQAAPGDVAASQHLRIALALYDDRQRKTQEIQALEGYIAGRLVHTPYVLLLSFPGINVVSAADFAGEMGPIEHYANARSITGRAGLRPSRYQSDQVDKANGPLVRNCNRSLRAAILGIADNLIVCNHHFQALATQWAAQGKDPRHTRVKIGLRFSRIAFQMVAGRQVFRHPSIQGRHYILDKLTAFHRVHDTVMVEVLAICKPPSGTCRRGSMLPKPNRWVKNSRESRTATAAARKCSAISCPSCWRVWGSAWYNPTSQGSRPPPHQVREPRTPFVDKGRTLTKAWRSLGSPTPDTAPWGRSPDLPVWR